MGIHINGDHNEVNVVHSDAYNYGGSLQRPPVGFVGLLFFGLLVAGLIIKFWWIVLIAVSVAAIAYGTWLEREEKRQAELAAKRKKKALAARAEQQNSAYLRGEPWGMYGQYPPPPEVRP